MKIVFAVSGSGSCGLEWHLPLEAAFASQVQECRVKKKKRGGGSWVEGALIELQLLVVYTRVAETGAGELHVAALLCPEVIINSAQRYTPHTHPHTPADTPRNTYSLLSLSLSLAHIS